MSTEHRTRLTRQSLSGTLLLKLAQMFPSSTLRLIQRTRDRGVRTFASEPNGERLLAAAEATRRLFREKRALELYRLAVRAGLANKDRAYCKTQIARLKAARV
jgi:hypothetical protein